MNNQNAVMDLNDNFNSISAPIGNAGNSYVGDPLPQNWWYPNYWYPTVEHHYHPVYTTLWVDKPNKIEQAFKILNKLVEKKIAKINTVKDFIETVNNIAEVL